MLWAICVQGVNNMGYKYNIIYNANGKQYGVDEATCPKRIVTSIVKCSKDLYCSVKTTCPVEKSKIKEVLHEIALIPPKNYQFGEILIKNVAKTDADIVVTGV